MIDIRSRQGAPALCGLLRASDRRPWGMGPTARFREATIMAGSEVETKVEKGNAFRDLVASMLDAAGFVAEAETRERFKKVDIRWRREDLDGPVRYVVEAKSGTLGMTECRDFLTDYGTLVECGDA